jgi:hypothetical protein
MARYLVILLLSHQSVFAQWPYVVDTVEQSFFSYDSSIIDNNIWQIGTTDKVFFDSQWVLVTDTTAMYDSLIDATIDLMVTRPWEEGSWVLIFDHKMDTDTNHAGGFLEINMDNDTLTYEYEDSTYETYWLKIALFPGISGNYDWTEANFYNVVTDQNHTIVFDSLNGLVTPPEWHVFHHEIDGYADSLLDSCVGFTGTYDDWETVLINWYYIEGIKAPDVMDTMTYRFHFISDSTSNDRNGWAIKNIREGYMISGSVDESAVQLRIHAFPSPTYDKVRFDLPANFEPAELIVFTTAGEELSKLQFDPEFAELDLSLYPAGTYFVRFNGSDGSIGYSKVIKL